MLPRTIPENVPLSMFVELRQALSRAAPCPGFDPDLADRGTFAPIADAAGEFKGVNAPWRMSGAHSAIKLWNQDWVYVSDEVYGTATGAGHGCPWGWARMVDISDPTAPTVEAEYRAPENDPATTAPSPSTTSYARTPAAGCRS